MSRIRARLAAWTAVAAIALGSQPALACSVCFSGSDESRVAFLVTTIFMTALPLLLVGSFAWWLRRRLQQLERGSQPPASLRAPGVS